ncbi:MAG TPA: hypothetical protein VGB46_03065 [Flavisolibacter sp.]|jgi:hypothetical protein
MRYFTFFALILLAACNSTREKSSSSNSTAAKENVQHIVFGRYCGMCPRNCATMYKVDVANDRLYIDTTDNFKNDYGKTLSFPSTPAPADKYRIAEEIVSRIPDSLFLAPNEERFGCPDCADGCGIFFEIQTPTYRKYFYIDYQTEQLEGYMKPFGEYLKKKIGEMDTRR